MSENEPHSSDFLQKFRLITQLLVISVAINIGLLATFVYQNILSSPEVFYSYEMSSSSMESTRSQISNSDYLTSIKDYPFRELVAILTDDELLEQGFRKRDLALSILVQDHYFNLQKALANRPFSERILEYKDGKDFKTIKVFPGLREYEYDAIIHFAVTEKWPMICKGLFYQLQANTFLDKDLVDAFCVTQEYHILETLFYQSPVTVSNLELVEVVRDYDWKYISRFCEDQKISQDLSIDKRRTFLLHGINHESMHAASILLKTDFLFVLQKLDDMYTLRILELIQKSSDEAIQLCVELLKSPRSDAVWQKSAQKLYLFHGEVPPEKLVYTQVVARFTNKASVQTTRTQLEEIARNDQVGDMLFHRVREGETLWKIARIYDVELADLIETNGLEGDQIRPGIQLLIP